MNHVDGVEVHVFHMPGERGLPHAKVQVRGQDTLDKKNGIYGKCRFKTCFEVGARIPNMLGFYMIQSCSVGELFGF